MVTIRAFEEQDVPGIGRLIADTYSQFNLSFLPEEHVGLFLGPFQHAYSDDPEHIEAIANVVHSEIVLIAETETGQIVGVLRGRKERLASLFVRGDYQRQGIGRRLIAAVAAHLMREGCTSLMLWTLAQNPSRGLYERLGGQLIGEKAWGGNAEYGVLVQEVAYGWPSIELLLNGDVG